MQFVFVTSLLSIQHPVVGTETVLLEIRIMCLEWSSSSTNELVFQSASNQHPVVGTETVLLEIRIMCLEWSSSSTNELVFQSASNIKIQLSVLV
jgi:hypothetical protein